jgi:hypothetical protein
MAAGKKWECTPEVLEIIRVNAERGVTEANIARLVRLSPSAFSAKKKEHPEMEEVIKQAQANSEYEVTGYLWNILRNPDHKQHFSAICFYLKTRQRWSDSSSNSDNVPQLPSGVNFILAGTGKNES